MILNLKTQEIIEAKKACEVLLEKTFPAKTAFKIVDLVRKLTSIEELFNDMKVETIKKYAKKDEENKIITETLENGQVYIPIAEEFQDKCAKEISDMLEQRQDLFFTPLEIEDLENENIVVKDLLPLYHFILKNEDSD